MGRACRERESRKVKWRVANHASTRTHGQHLLEVMWMNVGRSVGDIVVFSREDRVT